MAETTSINFDALCAPFQPADIEWRVQRCGVKGDKQWAMVLAYVTNRAIQQRLDDVCKPDNWKNEFRPAPDNGVLCGISIRIGDEWLTKFDGAENTNIEAVKGGLSDAMKRAAVQWGIGRYLYKLETAFVDVTKDKGAHYLKDDKASVLGYWNDPKLPDWAMQADVHLGDKLEDLRQLMRKAEIHESAIRARLYTITTHEEADTAIAAMKAKLEGASS